MLALHLGHLHSRFALFVLLIRGDYQNAAQRQGNSVTFLKKDFRAVGTNLAPQPPV